MSSTLLDPTINPDADGLVGSVTLWPSDALPSSKYMFAEGQAISRTLYSLLFARYSTLHGTGDGSTTFNLPNLVDKVPRGGDGDPATGSTGGTATATMPAHTHDAGTLTHNGATFGTGTQGLVGSPAVQIEDFSGPVTGDTGSAGGTGDNWPPYVTMRWIIKVL